MGDCDARTGQVVDADAVATLAVLARAFAFLLPLSTYPGQVSRASTFQVEESTYYLGTHTGYLWEILQDRLPRETSVDCITVPVG